MALQEVSYSFVFNFCSVVSHFYMSSKKKFFETMFLNAFPLIPCILKSLVGDEHFRLRIEEYLRTASFKSILLVLIKKRVCKAETETKTP